MMQRARSGPLGMIVVAAGVLVLSWLAIRSMTRGQQQALPPQTSATTGRDPSSPIVPPIPFEIVADAGKQGVARLDLVLRMDGIDVSSEGALACRSNNKTLIGREQNGGGAGSFNESALLACIASLRPGWGERKPVAVVSRAGDAVPKTHLDALVATIKRAGIVEVVLSP